MGGIRTDANMLAKKTIIMTYNVTKSHKSQGLTKLIEHFSSA
jgi:hypothetical protein